MIKTSTNKKFTSIEFNKMIGKIFDEVTEDLYHELRSNTPVQSGKARDGWILHKGRGVNTISNSVPYIDPLERGSSSQAPSGMIKPAVEKIKTNAKNGKYTKRNKK